DRASAGADRGPQDPARDKFGQLARRASCWERPQVFHPSSRGRVIQRAAVRAIYGPELPGAIRNQALVGAGGRLKTPNLGLVNMAGAVAPPLRGSEAARTENDSAIGRR